MNGRSLLISCVIAAGLMAIAVPAEAVDPRLLPGTLELQTVPPMAGVRFSADGSTVESNADGVARLPVSRFAGLEDRLTVPDTQINAKKKVSLDRIVGDPQRGVGGRPIPVGLKVSRLVRWQFSDLQGQPVPISRVSEMRFRSSMGETITVRGADLGKPRWVLAGRTVYTSSGLLAKDIYYVVDSVIVDGAQVVNKAQQRYVPNRELEWGIKLMFYRVKVQTRDALFGSPAGTSLELRRPDGQIVSEPLGGDGQVQLDLLPRGSYELSVRGTPFSIKRPAAISRDQVIELTTITYADVAVAGAAGILTAVLLLVLGQPRLRALLWRRRRPPGGPSSPAPTDLAADGDQRAAAGHAPPTAPAAAEATATTGDGVPAWRRLLRLFAASWLVAFACLPAAGTPAEAAGSAAPTPVLAYYYIWYTPTSWNRAKTDYPLAGRYSSDETEVMRKHIRQAKSVGIDGFLVSWKDLPHLTDRLEELTEIARTEGFQLGIVYQGLDFARQPLPIETVEHDLNRFAASFAADPVYRIFDKPLVVWTGTEKFSTNDISSVTAPLRDKLLILASAKKTEDYERVASAVDGNAHYWSSVRPEQADYTKRLTEMSATVHAHGGLWVAPAAPGFDARLVGGNRVIPRDDGETFRKQLAAAQSSSPDAIGIISWNEFSENSHIEPSERYGHTALEVLADVLGTQVQVLDDPDSSGEGAPSGPTGAQILGFLGGLVVLATLGYVVRRRRAAGPRAGGDPSAPATTMVNERDHSHDVHP